MSIKTWLFEKDRFGMSNWYLPTYTGVAIGVVVAILIVISPDQAIPPLTDSDGILTDNVTGCQYITEGGTTPRIDKDGVSQMGCTGNVETAKAGKSFPDYPFPERMPGVAYCGKGGFLVKDTITGSSGWIVHDTVWVRNGGEMIPCEVRP